METREAPGCPGDGHPEETCLLIAAAPLILIAAYEGQGPAC